ncbi:hypothetical protein HC928_23765, partial [bacterium]|nr:hypothetical protein [bacterium]
MAVLRQTWRLMPPPTTHSTRSITEVFVLALLLATVSLAAYLRMGQPGISEFKADEANLSLLALDMAYGRTLPLLGIGSSTGFPNAPVNVYLLALPYAIDSSPVLATQFIGLLNVFAVVIVYATARPVVGPFPALIAALLLAVSPWSVVFSRKIWAQNMLPPFVMLVMLAGFYGFVRGRRWGQWAFAPLLVLTGQIHYGAFVIVPSALYLLAAGRRRLTSAFWGGAFIALLLVLPFTIGLARAGLLSPSTWSNALAHGESAAIAENDVLTLNAEALHGAAIMVAGTEIHALAGPERFLDFLATMPEAYPLFNPLAGLVLLSALWLAYRAFKLRDARTHVDVALLLLLIFPVLAFSLTWTPFYIHYLIPLLPAAFLVLAFALYDLWGGLRAWAGLRWLLALGVIVYGSVLVVLQVLFSLALLDFVNENAT